MNSLTARHVQIDPTLPQPSWQPRLPAWMTADPHHLLARIETPDGTRRTAGTLTGAAYHNAELAKEAAGSTVWLKVGDEWHSQDGDWIVRRVQT